MKTEFEPPAEVAAIVARVAELARDGGIAVYVVGGSVRDALLGRPMHDLDLAVDRDALPFARLLADAFGGHFVELDDVNAIARVVLDDAAVRYIDVAQLHGALERDMHRRDFTIDALAAVAGGREVIDVCEGVRDLRGGLVRMNGAYVFDDDALRLLRGPRIAAELGFALESGTAAEIRARAPAVRTSAAERQRDELARMLALDDACGALRLLDELGLLDVLIPELARGKGIEQPGAFHAYDVFEHGMHAVEATDIMLAPPASNVGRTWMRDAVWEAFGWAEESLRAHLAEETSEGRPRSALLKLAALLHDVAKPETLTFDEDGRVRFFGHADLGARIASDVLRRLRFSAREVRFVSVLVAEHLRPVQLAGVGEAPTRRAIYRFYRDLGEAAPAVLLLALADAASARGPGMTSEAWVRHVGYMNSLLVRSMEGEGIVNPPRILSGRDIMDEVGIAEGPAVGRLLEAVREAQAAGEVTDRASALAHAARMARAESSGDRA